MLNYKKLNAEFDNILKSFTKEDLEKWIAMDANRMLEEFKCSILRLSEEELESLKANALSNYYIAKNSSNELERETYSKQYSAIKAELQSRY